jgi:Protein of unknown function (DUF2914)
VRALAEYSLVSPLLSTIKRYERPLSAISMVAGFIFDNHFFERVDHPATQIVLAVYLVVAIGTILVVHHIESYPDDPGLLHRLHPILVAATAFALGGLWSAFLIFYGRALTAATWPFVAFLAGLMIANEVLRQYHARLAFTLTLLFLALFSYTIFVVPIVTGTMGRATFVLSGALAAAAFAALIFALGHIGTERIERAWRSIAIGAVAVFGGLNGLYFTNILPPLPLTLARADVFHSVTKEGDTYRAVAEAETGDDWLRLDLFGGPPVMRVERGGSLSAYSAVFAPIQLRTDIVHTWRRYDEISGTWRTESRVRFPIVGGREGGYRGYSVKSQPANGRWRVDIETPEGLLIGRVAFTVSPGGAAGRTPQVVR